MIDPHGDLVEDTKSFLASFAAHEREEILERVVVVDPTDPKYTVGFNPLESLPGVSAAEQAQELNLPLGRYGQIHGALVWKTCCETPS